jgi:branched-chain amino acid transport system permease protein
MRPERRHLPFGPRWYLLVVIGLLLVFPFLGPFFFADFYVFLMTEALIFAIFALGFDFLFGYTRVISFGHAAFFGTAAYTGGLLLAHVTDSAFVILAIGILAATAYAVLVSVFALRSSGIYFALVTFAFAQLLYEVVIRTREITGGFSGLAGLPDVYLLGIELDKLPIYYLVLGFTVVSYLVARRIMASPMGLTFRCIGQNDQRINFIGYNMRRYKQIAFVLSGIYAGLAGGLFLIHQNFVGPNSLFWLLSGEVIVMTMFGGMGTLVGPMIGAVLFVYLGEVLSLFLEQWRIVFGFLFVFVVLFFPEGLVGVVDQANVAALRDRLPIDFGSDDGD